MRKEYKGLARLTSLVQQIAQMYGDENAKQRHRDQLDQAVDLLTNTFQMRMDFPTDVIRVTAGAMTYADPPLQESPEEKEEPHHYEEDIHGIKYFDKDGGIFIGDGGDFLLTPEEYYSQHIKQDIPDTLDEIKKEEIEDEKEIPSDRISGPVKYYTYENARPEKVDVLISNLHDLNGECLCGDTPLEELRSHITELTHESAMMLRNMKGEIELNKEASK